MHRKLQLKGGASAGSVGNTEGSMMKKRNFFCNAKSKAKMLLIVFLRCQNGRISGIRLLFSESGIPGPFISNKQRNGSRFPVWQKAGSCLLPVHRQEHLSIRICQSLRNFSGCHRNRQGESLQASSMRSCFFFMPGSLFIFFRIHPAEEYLFSQEVQSRTQVWLSDLERDSMSWTSRDIRFTFIKADGNKVLCLFRIRIGNCRQACLDHSKRRAELMGSCGNKGILLLSAFFQRADHFRVKNQENTASAETAAMTATRKAILIVLICPDCASRE